MKATTGLMMVAVTGAFLACLGPAPAVAALPPDPDNAALLYYQAFLLVPQTDDRALTDLVLNVANGGVAPNEQVREYIKKCRDAIDCALAASELPHCNWGLRYSKGFSAAFPHLAQVRSLTRLIVADARILAAEGDYRQALERCLAAHRLAGHVGDETLISLLVSIAISAQANKCVTAVLEQMPADVDTLTWLKGQLAAAPITKLSVNRAMTLEEEISSQYLRPERVTELLGVLSEQSGMNAEEMRKLIDAPALERARAYGSNYVGSARAILSGQTPYAESYAKLQGLAQQMEQAAAQDPAIRLVKSIAPAMLRVYVLQTRHKADFNALGAALDLYLAKAGTGRLPQALAVDSPRDPYTGSAFKYQPTTTGFVLECGAKDLDKNEARRYEFKVK
jgi:hypothetical protein